MTDLLFWGASAGVTIASSLVASFAAARAASRPLRARIAELEESSQREAAAVRRREGEAARRHGAVERRLRLALGLAASGGDDVVLPTGRALAEQVVERVRGLATVDGCLVADEVGLAWTSDDFEGASALAAAAGAGASVRLRGLAPRALHVELDDARHVVVRPLPGTMPTLALAVASTSRPASAFALDAALAHVTLLAGVDDDPPTSEPWVGWASRVSRADAPVTVAIAAELETACRELTCGAMAMLVGDEVVAAFGSDGPREDELGAIAQTLRGVLARFESRMGSHGRRVDWEAAGGTTISLSPLGTSGRTSILAVRRAGAVDGRAFDRLGGRLRRLLPAEAPHGGRAEVRA